MATSSQIQEGNKVRASYRLVDGEKKAVQLEVTSGAAKEPGRRRK